MKKNHSPKEAASKNTRKHITKKQPLMPMRCVRIMNALVECHSKTREEIDKIAPASISPQYVGLIRKELGLEAECEHVHFATKDCKRFSECNAPICPLDPDWQKRTYLDGGPACPYRLEWSKEITRPILDGAIGGDFASALAEGYPKIMRAYGPLRKRLKRASHTPSRMVKLEVKT